MRQSPIYAGKPCTFAEGIARLTTLNPGWKRLLGMWLILFPIIPLLAQTIPGAGSVETGILTDLVISGPGYFVVRDLTLTDGRLLVTRQGEFEIDENGYLVTNAGMRVQGYSDVASAQIGDIKIFSDGTLPEIFVTGYAIQNDGKILLSLNDGSQVVREQILLQNVLTPANLEILPLGLRGLTPSSQPLPNPIPPGTGGLGTLLSGQLEIPQPILTFSRDQSPPAPFAQGALTATGVPTDLSIQGAGFFMVRDTNANEFYPTRAGAFFLDRDGYLINYAGMRVQGYSDIDLSTVGDIEINTNGVATSGSATISRFSIDWSGTITVGLTDGTDFVRGKILLENCSHPELLVKTNFGLYTSVAAAGPWTPPTSPRTAGLGLIVSGSVELNKCDDAILEFRKHLNFFSQGALVEGTNPTDVAISGIGFFTVRDPVQDVLYASRNGAFHLDSANRLVDTNGFRVQGLTDSTGTNLGDIVIDAAGAATSGNSNATMVDFAIDSKGSIQVVLSNGNVFMRGQILLQNFGDLQALKLEANHLYSNVSGAIPLHPIGIPTTQGLGIIIPDALEIENLPQVLQLPLPPETGYHLFVSNLNTLATVEASIDLRNWAPIGEVAGSVIEEGEFVDTNAPAMPQRFYRLKIPAF